MTVRAVVLNVMPEPRTPDAESAIETVRQAVPDATLFTAGECGVIEPGRPGLERWSRGVRRLTPPKRAGRRGRKAKGRRART